MDNISDLVAALQTTHVSVTGVSFAGKALKLDTEADAKPVVEAINNCKDLQYFNLEGNTLGVDASKEIAKALEKHPEFKRALWKDMFTGRMKTEIPKALEFLGNGLVISGSRLTELDLSDNAFGPIGVQGLASLLCSPSCYYLEELRLNNNGLGTEGGKLLAKALLDCYKCSKEQGKPLSLKVFIAGRNRLENHGATALSEVFKTIGTLEEIAMPQNGIYHAGITALSAAFKENKNLKILNLNDNTIGSKGAQSLALALEELSSIRDLNFGDCLLKTKGVQYLAKGLKNNTTLEELSLGFNEIKAEGALELIESLKNKTKLKNLILDGNHFGSKGKQQVQNKLKEIGKINVLGSLSDDESEDDESDSEEVGEESETEDEKEVSIEIVPAAATITADNFLKSPDYDKFLKLGESRNSVVLNELKKYLTTNIEDYVPFIMKIAALSCNKDILYEVTTCCELLFKELFTYGHNADKISLINNAILVNLGLIKSEDKKFKPTWNTDCCFSVLRSLVKKNYFPESTRDTLKLFLQRGEELPAKKELLMVLC